MKNWIKKAEEHLAEFAYFSPSETLLFEAISMLGTLMDERKKLRQLLKRAETIRKKEMIFNDKYTVQAGLEKICKCIDEALTLLPCPTCNGTGDSKASVVDDLSGGIVDTEIPCPDCQSESIPMPTDDDRRSEGYHWCGKPGHGWYFQTCDACQS